MLVMTRFSMRSRTATHSLATLSIIACIGSPPTACLLSLIVYTTNCIYNYRFVKREPVIFPEGSRIRARPRRETYGAVSGADRADAPHTTGLTAYKEGVDTGCVFRSIDDLRRRCALFDAFHGGC